MHRMDKSNGGIHMCGSRVTIKCPDQPTLEKSGTAVKEVSMAVPQLGRRLSKPLPGRTHEGIVISLKGLLAAQRFSKGLRERTALKLAAKKGIGATPVMIIKEQVTQLLQRFLSSRLEGVSYEASHSNQLVQGLSEDLKGLVRAVCPSRYKLICILSLGQAEWEGAMLASRCLWDQHSDTFASHAYKSPHIFCTAMVFAVYYE